MEEEEEKKCELSVKSTSIPTYVVEHPSRSMNVTNLRFVRLLFHPYDRPYVVNWQDVLYKIENSST